MSLNKVLLLGRLGKDPEIRMTPQQLAVGKFSLATSDRKKDASGNFIQTTDWHSIVTFGKVAENVQKYLKKGSQALIEGKLVTRKWVDKQTGKDRYITEVIAHSVEFLGSKAADGQHPSEPREPAVPAGASVETEAPSFDDDDIPF